MQKKHLYQVGFTLIELLVVVAIVAFLVAIAYPNYSAFAARSRRAEGREMLMRVASAQERYFTNFNAYAPSVAALGFTAQAPCTVAGASERCHYNVTTANGASGDAQSFMLTAAPAGIQIDDKCGNLTLTSAGGKGYSGPGGNGICWP
jgi:type IV pilus assembly protein PilE